MTKETRMSEEAVPQEPLFELPEGVVLPNPEGQPDNVAEVQEVTYE